MGLAEPILRLLLERHRETPFRGPVLTLGVQHLGVTHDELINLMRHAGVTPAPTTVPGNNNHPLAADTLFAMLGLPDTQSLDKYDGEGATILHDLNEPVRAPLRQAFNLVLDGGTLEHLFDVASAMKNIIDMVKPGGQVVHISPVSGWENHGFFSINPKLLHRTYSANGFGEFRSFLVHLPRSEETNDARIEPLEQYDAPLVCNSRDERTLLVFIATRVEMVPTFITPVDSHQKLNETHEANPKLRDDLLQWEQEEDFNRIYESGVARCGFGPRDRYYVLKELLTSLKQLNGDTAECGVYHGLGSFILCQYATAIPRLPDHQHHLFDSFEGLSAPATEDTPHPGIRPWKQGDMLGTLDQVRANLADFPECKYHAGWIPACFEAAADRRFSFVHIDVDLYEPTRDAVNFFYPRLVPGGIILFDDDGFLTCPGSRQAINEFIEQTGASVVRLPTGQAFVIHPAE